MTALKLYDHPISGNCYKIRLLLALLNVEYQRIPVDILNGESQTPEFKQMNPRGQIPVIKDDDNIVWDSMAILTYIARRYGNEQWLPKDPLSEALVMQWLAVSENELLYGLARSRAALLLKRPFNLEQCQKEAHAGLDMMNQHLEKQSWLAAEHPTIADIACYPYITVAHEGEVSLEPYPYIQAWMGRIEALPGWVSMQS